MCYCGVCNLIFLYTFTLSFAISHRPDTYLSMIVDGMDQGKTYLPMMKRRAKNDKVKFMKQKLTGVCGCVCVCVCMSVVLLEEVGVIVDWTGEFGVWAR